MLLNCFRAAWSALLLGLVLFAAEAKAQAPKTYSSSEILLGLKKLNVLGSVLYIAAHPDDENTRLIAYMANGRLVETGYFSCTRGDGGQNLIGPELREQLGVIRTQELLAARRIDGGRQFFSRANDFGFSKTAEETFTLWDREQVLADMVWVIRQRRPDVLITRFPPDQRAGHGHHTASAMLALDAFDAAGDPKRFPEQLQYVQPWQPKRLFWNTGSFFVKPGEDMSGYLKIDAGGYNPLLGQSYGEIAARSRSQHRSQGFGSAATRGEALEYLQLLKGEKATKDPLEGVDMSWNRVKGGAAVGKLVEEVIRKFDANNPTASVPELLMIQAVMADKRFDISRSKEKNYNEALFWIEEKSQEIDELMFACLGLSLSAIAQDPTVTPNGAISIAVEAVNRSNADVKLNAIKAANYNDLNIQPSGKISGSEEVNQPLAYNKPFAKQLTLKVSVERAVSQPYWLRQAGTVGMYQILNEIERFVSAEDPQRNARITAEEVIGIPENPPIAEVLFDVTIAGSRLRYRVPVQYKRTDPVYGELYRPLAVVPPVAVNLIGDAFVFADNQPKTVPVTLKAGRADAKGSVALQVPAGWKVEPASIPFELKNKDEERSVEFRVQPSADKTGNQESTGQLRAVATMDGQQYSRGLQLINYPHIPVQTLFPEAVAPLTRLDLKRRADNIGYLMGAGDEVPEALRQIGYNVTLLKPEDLTPQSLRRFDAVVLGVRAYNTVERLRYAQPALLEYVEKGGNLIVQYTVSRGTVLPEIGPYPMKLSNDRVTVENAPVKFLKPQHPLLNVPNKITERDFQGWVQEQGLYYPNSWDAKYQPIISSQDPGESPKEGGILVAEHGKGHYIYTGLSFFRELPAGVPGAYRLLTNMIELGKQKTN